MFFVFFAILLPKKVCFLPSNVEKIYYCKFIVQIFILFDLVYNPVCSFEYVFQWKLYSEHNIFFFSQKRFFSLKQMWKKIILLFRNILFHLVYNPVFSIENVFQWQLYSYPNIFLCCSYRSCQFCGSAELFL